MSRLCRYVAVCVAVGVAVCVAVCYGVRCSVQESVERRVKAMQICCSRCCSRCCSMFTTATRCNCKTLQLQHTTNAIICKGNTLTHPLRLTLPHTAMHTATHCNTHCNATNSKTESGEAGWYRAQARMDLVTAPPSKSMRTGGGVGEPSKRGLPPLPGDLVCGQVKPS